MTVDHVETEWQFESTQPPQRWLRRAELPAGFAIGAATSQSIADIYYDTEDWRLYRAGYALRIRQTGHEREATMKQLAPAREGRHQRRELTTPIATAASRADDAPRAQNVIDRLQGLLADRIHAIAGTHAVRPILELRTRRRSFTIEREGRAVGELALDVTTVPVDGSAVPTRFYRIEVEVAPGVEVADLEPLVDALRDGAGLAATDHSKFEEALHARGVVPSPLADLGSSAVDARSTTAAVAFAALRRSFAAVLEYEPASRLGDDPEALHQMRVATRRLRAVLALFRDALPARAAAYRVTLGWIAGALGAVRDLDVQLERIESWRTEMEPGDAAALGTIADLLRRRRLAARRRMLRVLDCRRYDRFIAGFTALLKGPEPRRGMGRRPIVDTAPALIRKRMRTVRRAGEALLATSPASAYHELRIRCKKLRYAVDVHADAYGKPLRRMSSKLADLQQMLGAHQDAQVAVAELRALCDRRGRSLGPRALFVIGTIAERYEREAERLRGKFSKRYRAATGARWRKLRRAMEKRMSAPSPKVAVRVPEAVSGTTLAGTPAPEGEVASVVIATGGVPRRTARRAAPRTKAVR